MKRTYCGPPSETRRAWTGHVQLYSLTTIDSTEYQCLLRYVTEEQGTMIGRDAISRARFAHVDRTDTLKIDIVLEFSKGIYVWSYIYP